MAAFSSFLSIVFVVRNQGARLSDILTNATLVAASLVRDFEIIVVDNASEDDSVAVLKSLASESGLPNLQIYALTKEIDTDTASWVGLENALGDFVAVIDPVNDDIGFLPEMLEKAALGADVVFASNKNAPKQGLAYGLASSVFNRLYKHFVGIDLAKDAPHFRVLSKRVVNFILQHPQPAMTYRHLPATGGFARVNLQYSSVTKAAAPKRLFDSVDRGMRLLVSTTRAPMRIVTTLSMFGAAANVLYSIYVLGVAAFKQNVAPGWVSSSLQQSGMFFLISLVLLVLGEYILQMARGANEGPLYHVAQEFTSARMTRHQKLNVEQAQEAETRVLEPMMNGRIGVARPQRAA